MLRRLEVAAQAQKLCIRPGLGESGLGVIAFQQRIEDVPRGALRVRPDCELPRQQGCSSTCGRIAWRLNIPWIDCGVLGSQGGGARERLSLLRPLCRSGVVPRLITRCLSRSTCAERERDWGTPPWRHRAGRSGRFLSWPLRSQNFSGPRPRTFACGRQVILDANHHYSGDCRRPTLCRITAVALLSPGIAIRSYYARSGDQHPRQSGRWKGIALHMSDVPWAEPYRAEVSALEFGLSRGALHAAAA